MKDLLLIVCGDSIQLPAQIANAATARGWRLTILAEAAGRAEAIARSANGIGAEAIALELPAGEGEGEIRAIVGRCVAPASDVSAVIVSQENANTPLMTIDFQRWNQEVVERLDRLFVLSQAVAAAIAAKEAGGAILQVLESSVSGGVSCVTNAAFANFARAMALDLGHRRIRVNALVCRSGSGSVGSAAARDAARTAIFLSSDDARYMTGAVVDADCGAQ